MSVRKIFQNASVVHAWSQSTQLEVLLEYLENIDNPEDLDNYLGEVYGHELIDLDDDDEEYLDFYDQKDNFDAMIDRLTSQRCTVRMAGKEG